MNTKEKNTNLLVYKSSIYKLLFLIFIFYTFKIPISNILSTLLINPIFSKVESLYLNDVLFILISILVAIYLLKKVDNKTQIRITVIASTFYLINRFADLWTFTTFKLTQLLGYGDVIAIAIICPGLIQLISSFYKLYAKKASKGSELLDGSGDNHIAFLEDNPIESDSEDTFQRISTAKGIANSINHTNNKKSFAIGIIGEYGSGKTSFLNLIEKCLREEEKTPLLLNFSPWSSEKASNIQKDFFDLLVNKLAEIDSKLATLLYAYSRKLSKIDSTTDKIINRIHLINHLYSKGYNVDNYERINSLLKKANRKVIIIIDDLDRLHSDEVVEVLRIIRNTANFANVFYIVAYDKAYILEAIRCINEKGYLSYLDKIFQLEIPLPKREDKNLHELLGTGLKPIINDLHFKDLEEDIMPLYFETNYDDSLKKVFRNLRDIVKFLNSFSISYRLIHEDILFKDLFFNELLKYRYPLVYDLIYEQIDSFLHRRPFSSIYREYYIIRTEKDEINSTPLLIKYLEEQESEHYNKEDRNLIHRLLKKLYVESASHLYNHPINSIANPAYFDIYYRNRLSNYDLSEAGYNAALKLDIWQIHKYINDCLAKSLHRQILVRLLREENFVDQEHFEKIISAISYLGPKYIKEKGFTSFPTLDFIKLIIDFNGNIIDNIYQDNKNAYNEFIKSFFEGVATPPFIFQNEIIFKIKENYANHFLLTPEELTKYHTSYFSRLSGSKHGLSKEAVWLFWGSRILTKEGGSYHNEDSWSFVPEIIPVLKQRLKNNNLNHFLKSSIGKNIYSKTEFNIQNKILKEVFNTPLEFREIVSKNEFSDPDLIKEFLAFFDRCAEADFKRYVQFDFKTELKP